MTTATMQCGCGATDDAEKFEYVTFVWDGEEETHLLCPECVHWAWKRGTLWIEELEGP